MKYLSFAVVLFLVGCNSNSQSRVSLHSLEMDVAKARAERLHAEEQYERELRRQEVQKVRIVE